MLKRKYGNRANWKRLVEKEIIHTTIDTDDFKGTVSLIKMKKVTSPLYVQYGDNQICIAGEGYIWLQHFPANEHYSLTTMFNGEGKIVQWYIDICLKNGIENDVPWMDDLFLDIIILPTGEVIIKDVDELNEALAQGVIDEILYQLAWNEKNKIEALIKQGSFTILKLVKTHKDYLLTLQSS